MSMATELHKGRLPRQRVGAPLARPWLLGLGLAWLIACGEAQKDDDCTQYDFCAEKGRCTFDGNSCVVASDADCKQSRHCSYYGQCTFNGRATPRDKCIATSNEECAQSQACKDKGMCTLHECKNPQPDGWCGLNGDCVLQDP